MSGNSGPQKKLSDLKVAGQRVLVRVDFNVPLDGNRITDDTRIRASLKTIKYLIENDAKLVIASHLGRPKGKPDPKLSLEPAALRLAELLGTEVMLTDDCIGDGARKVVSDLREGHVAVLENLRFHPEEKDNDIGFAKELLNFCDIYVNDAFGTAHREHASVVALPRLVKHKAPGFLMQQELAALDRLRESAERPYFAVLGGAKVSDKIDVIEELMGKVDALLIGGAMANTFLAAQGHTMGKSLVEEDKLALARSILQDAEQRGVDVMLPVDVLVAETLDASEAQARTVDAVQPNEMALDIGPETVAVYQKRLRKGQSIFWNGPMGLFENDAFKQGTLGVATAVAGCLGFSVVGGGDSVAAVNQAQLASRFGHVSTGGGASLQYLEGKKLPGVLAMLGEPQ